MLQNINRESMAHEVIKATVCATKVGTLLPVEWLNCCQFTDMVTMTILPEIVCTS